MENKDIVEALEQVPALVKAAETFKATSGHIVSSLADAVKQRPQAEIPESELQKISQTPCAPPDVDSFSKALVQKVAGDIGSTIKEAAYPFLLYRERLERIRRHQIVE